MTKKELVYEINKTLRLIGSDGISTKRLMRCSKDSLIALYGSILIAAREIVERREIK